MNKILSIAALVLSVSALSLTLFAPRETTRATEAASPSDTADGRSADLQELELRIGALEDKAQGLSIRIRDLERRPATAQQAGPNGVPVADGSTDALSAEVARLRSDIQDIVAGEALSSEGGRGALKEAVRSVQDELATEQRQQRMQRWAQAASDAQQDRIDHWKQFVSDQHLSYAQEQELMKRMNDENAKLQAAMQAMQNGDGSPREAFRDLRQVRRDNDQAMKQLLSDDQFASYKEARREDRPGFPGGGGGGGGGRRGGGRQQPQQ